MRWSNFSAHKTLLNLCQDGKTNEHQNNRFGLFAPDFGIRIEPAYEKIGRLGEENDWVRVQQNGKWGWVDKTGKVIIPCRFDAASPFRRGRAQVLQLPYMEFFYINTKGEMLLGR